MPDLVGKERMAALTDHPGWPELCAYFEDRYEQVARDLGKHLLSGGMIEPEDLARRQGQWRAIRTLLSTPEAFESMLKWEFQQQEEGK